MGGKPVFENDIEKSTCAFLKSPGRASLHIYLISHRDYTLGRLRINQILT